MSTDSSITTDSSEFALLPPARFTADQYVQMIEAGVFDDGQRVELIHGIITPMAPAGPDHHWSTTDFPTLFAPVLDRFYLSVQGTLKLGGDNVFDPDFMLLNRKPKRSRKTLPGPRDVALLVESAASSLQRDRTTKLAAYAQAGITEYWILDLEREVLHAFRQPESSCYREEHSLSGEDTISPLACPDLQLTVASLFE